MSPSMTCSAGAVDPAGHPSSPTPSWSANRHRGHGCRRSRVPRCPRGAGRRARACRARRRRWPPPAGASRRADPQPPDRSPLPHPLTHYPWTWGLVRRPARAARAAFLASRCRSCRAGGSRSGLAGRRRRPYRQGQVVHGIVPSSRPGCRTRRRSYPSTTTAPRAVTGGSTPLHGRSARSPGPGGTPSSTLIKGRRFSRTGPTAISRLGLPRPSVVVCPDPS